MLTVVKYETKQDYNEQQWNATKYIYSSTLFKYNIEVANYFFLSISIFYV